MCGWPGRPRCFGTGLARWCNCRHCGGLESAGNKALCDSHTLAAPPLPPFIQMLRISLRFLRHLSLGEPNRPREVWVGSPLNAG